MFEFGSMAVEWFGVGAFLAALGALIKFRRWTFLVAGYDRSSSVPEDVVADIVGSTVLRIGLAAVALGVVFTLADAPSYVATLFGVIVAFAVARLLYRLRTYSPSDAT